MVYVRITAAGIRLFAAGLLIITGASVAGCNCRDGFLYHPDRALVATPEQAGLAYEEVWLTARDGIRLNGWWVPAERPKGTVIFCHGNGGNISYLIETIAIYHAMALNIFVFDYRGYGASGGLPSEEGTYLDAAAAWDHLISGRGIAPGAVIVVGRSLGGPIAAWLCADRSPGALVLESTFTRARDVANLYHPLAPGRLIFGDTYDTVSHLARVRCPVLVVHSPDDDVVPYELGRRLYGLAPGRRAFLMIRGSHNSGFFVSRESYRSGIERFLRAATDPAGGEKK